MAKRDAEYFAGLSIFQRVRIGIQLSACFSTQIVLHDIYNDTDQPVESAIEITLTEINLNLVTN